MKRDICKGRADRLGLILLRFGIWIGEIPDHQIVPTQRGSLSPVFADCHSARARRDGHLEYWRDAHSVLAIAAPIRDHTGQVVASVGLGMPGARFKPSQRKTIVGAVKQTAARISAELGYAQPTAGRAPNKGTRSCTT